ncbi:hypothetical protein HYDPIDRAFT_27672 [Hydnomerulius pinastri MD-312]|nr:hypothetical protein HYDPIDRAFT_27672 [Hydnomerulius pinastri MD-312]
MKFLTLPTALLASCVTLAASQSIQIGAPADGSTAAQGSTITVQVDRPNFNSQSTEVAVVIGFYPCFDTEPLSCPSVARNGIGAVLYNGPFNPQYPNPNPDDLPPLQSFNVTIPTWQTGPAVLSVTHFAFLGALNGGPLVETKNITIEVV